MPDPGPRRRQICYLNALVLLVLGAVGAHAGDGPVPVDDQVARLIAAYPSYLSRLDGGDLVWADGTRTRIENGLAHGSHTSRLAEPSLRDIFHQTYPDRPWQRTPGVDEDPGRFRPRELFDKMYGDCRRGEVERHLVAVPWLPQHRGGTISVTRVNGVSERLAAVSSELDKLPAQFTAYLLPAAGGYHCRQIAGTERTSAHGHGIAVDIATRTADYWRWSGHGREGKALTYRNRVPAEIVAVFERHGFIWGGAWYHYDTMHFEFRPEMLGNRVVPLVRP